MNMRLLLILCCVLSAVFPPTVFADSTNELIVQLPNGHINWTQGALIVKGIADSSQKTEAESLPAQSDIVQQARQQATSNILSSLALIKMDAHLSILDHLSADKKVFTKVEEMSSVAPIISQTELADGSVAVIVQMQLFGGFSQLILPADIKQVDTIKPMNSQAEKTDESQIVSISGQIKSKDPDVYTGLIVDARGIGAEPAMVPVLFDEDGKEVYSPAFISREYAVQKGDCRYVRSLNEPSPDRVGSRPLTVKGLRLTTGQSCDIVISNADASKLHSSSAHLKFLKQCKVIIVLD